MKRVFKFSSTETSGVFGVYLDSETGYLKITHIGGAAPYVDLVPQVLTEYFSEEVEHVLATYNRKNMFRTSLRKGMSGVLDAYMEWAEPRGPFHVRRKKLVVHVSMYGKLNEDLGCYLPDFFEVLGEYKNELLGWVSPKEFKIEEINLFDPDKEGFLSPYQVKAYEVWESLVSGENPTTDKK